MNRVITFILTLAFMSALRSAPMSAQEGDQAAQGGQSPVRSADTTTIWDLDRCLRVGLERSLQLRLSATDLAEARSQAARRKAARYGDLSMQAVAVRLPEAKTIETPFATFTMMDKELYDLKLSIEQPLFTGGALRESYRAALAVVDAVQWQQKALANQVRYDITQAYYRMAQAEVLVAIAEQSQSQVKAHVSDVQNLYDQGMVLRNDVLKVQVYESQATLKVHQAETIRRQAQLALLYSMSADLAATIIIPKTLEYRPRMIDLDRVIARALAEKPELRALRAQAEAADKAVAVVRSGFWPAVQVTGSYGYGLPGQDLGSNQWNDYWTIALGSKVTVTDWGKRRQELIGAKAVVERLAIELQRVRQGVEADLRNCYLNVKDAERRVELTQTEQIQAEENFNLTKDLVSQGLATSTDFMDAETQVTAARTNHSKAQLDYYLAINELERAAGGCLDVLVEEAAS